MLTKNINKIKNSLKNNFKNYSLFVISCIRYFYFKHNKFLGQDRPFY